MAGVSDAPFRRICGEMGASLTYTEMVSARALTYGNRKTEELTFSYPDEGPFAIQIFGHEEEIMAEAAEKLSSLPNMLLDINMGCPVPKVVKNGDGSALLKNPGQIERIVRACVSCAGKPVTVKIRAGFTDEDRNAPDCAKAAEEGGAAAVAVHGRTREQYYTGTADLRVIRAVTDAVSIPVIGNGDVTDAASARRMFEETGCDFIMIARGARGNPWIFRELTAAWNGGDMPSPPSMGERKQVLLRYFRDLTDQKGSYTAVREIRSAAGWYLKGIPGAAALRREICRISDASEMEARIRAL